MRRVRTFFIKVSIKDAILHIYTPLKSMVRAVTDIRPDEISPVCVSSLLRARPPVNHIGGLTVMRHF